MTNIHELQGNFLKAQVINSPNKTWKQYSKLNLKRKPVCLFSEDILSDQSGEFETEESLVRGRLAQLRD